MQRREKGATLMAVGVLAVLIAVLADPLGIGGDEDTFGWKQIVLLAVGVVVALAGVVAFFRPGGPKSAGAAEGGDGTERPGPPNGA